MIGSEHRTVETVTDFKVGSQKATEWDLQRPAPRLHGGFHISTIINIDAIFTINIDAQCGCATTRQIRCRPARSLRLQLAL